MSEHRSFSRRERVAEQIRRDLSDLIRLELKDPRVGMISLTSVEVSADYAHAKIFFSTLEASERVPEILAGLEKASGFLRHELGKRISTHMTPQLHFIFDASIERGAELSELIRQAISISDAAP
ncbi:MAG: 30S ribosome-binding factor RbfA [Candidatus Accumulibacter sp.]|jgi:ribosome-binding factor A|nr:30S ribosome-binding factor RbfA [Accumulibacter sp.]